MQIETQRIGNRKTKNCEKQWDYTVAYQLYHLISIIS